MRVNVISGDITQTTKTVDAIATLINSSGMWFGGVDRAIQRRCSDYYHSHLSTQMGRQSSDGQVFIVKGKVTKNFSFKDVIFIIDDLALPLKTLVFNTLCAAQEAGYKRVAIPSMRTGVMAGVVEKTVLDTVLAMKQGFLSFREKYPNSGLTVDIIVYSDADLERLLKDNVGC